jgi:hypothetical protein
MFFETEAFRAHREYCQSAGGKKRTTRHGDKGAGKCIFSAGRPCKALWVLQHRLILKERQMTVTVARNDTLCGRQLNCTPGKADVSG